MATPVHRFSCAPLLLALLFAPLASTADDHATILMYHHVADDTPSSTSVTPERFAEHLDYLVAHDYRVLPVEEILERLAKRAPLPEDSIAITFDDAYLSVYNIARPMLDSREMPYTVFVSTEFIDLRYGNYMTWEQLRSIAAYGGTIGNHGVRHQSALARDRGETREKWLERFRADALQAQQRIRAETGVVSTIYAWPYGEYNADVERVLDELAWYGLGQQSGVAGYGVSMTAVPRFPISTDFSDEAAFAIRVRAEPLPVEISSAPERLLPRGDPAPKLEFRLQEGPYALEAVDCFDGRGGRLDLKVDSSGTIAVQSSVALAAGRSKYTCTAPHREKSGVFGWYSHLWVVSSR
jgi:peptidoglycan/xylan/chitin deacetylase (PgdA/CDA1 family)